MTDFSTPSLRHLALLTRNPLATSAFTYAVLTTKIYCRPDCPSRLARRANITFFDTASEAAVAGFRPCKRCAPDVEKGMSSQEMVVEKACQSMGQRVRGGGTARLEEVAREVGWTKSHFCRVFRRVKGVTVGQWVKGLEMEGGRSTEVKVDVDAVDKCSIGPVEVEVGEREDWDVWLNYSACSTPVLSPLIFPCFD